MVYISLFINILFSNTLINKCFFPQKNTCMPLKGFVCVLEVPGFFLCDSHTNKIPRHFGWMLYCTAFRLEMSYWNIDPKISIQKAPPLLVDSIVVKRPSLPGPGLLCPPPVDLSYRDWVQVACSAWFLTHDSKTARSQCPWSVCWDFQLKRSL